MAPPDIDRTVSSKKTTIGILHNHVLEVEDPRGMLV
jgi:hypothetical protein